MNPETRRYPINGTFELTGRCNLGCKMCLVRVDAVRIKELGLREHTADEWIYMAEQASKAGTLTLLLTGGEVMIRPDFCEIYGAIAKMGFVLTVYTNATMVTDSVMDIFRRYPPHKIGVTMYGTSNETYQKLCGCPDGYDRFVDGIKLLSSLPSLFNIRTTIVRDNWGDLDDMRTFVKNNFGEDKILNISTFVMNKIRGSIADPISSRLNPQEHIRMLYPHIIEYWKKTKCGILPQIQINTQLKRHTLPPDGHYLFESCGAGYDSYSIDWSGRMYACELLNQGSTEPFETGFEKAWKSLPQQYPVSRCVKQCEACEYAYVCSSCPAYRLGETGDWFGVPRFSCETAKFLHNIILDVQTKNVE